MVVYVIAVHCELSRTISGVYGGLLSVAHVVTSEEDRSIQRVRRARGLFRLNAFLVMGDASEPYIFWSKQVFVVLQVICITLQESLTNLLKLEISMILGGKH